MTTSSAAVVDLEAATDQLVDEVCARLTALYGLLDISVSETGVPVDVIRSRATEVVRRLASSQPRVAAGAIARALWPLQTATQVPPNWWDTPLGTVIARARPKPPVRPVRRAGPIDRRNPCDGSSNSEGR